jgi:hypothetical protein
MKKHYLLIFFITLMCLNAQAQSLQVIQPTDSLEQSRQKENCDFLLFNEHYFERASKKNMAKCQQF